MVRKRTRGLPKELSRVNLNAAGIDVGASSHFVAVSEASAEECVREFEAYTSELYRMAVKGGRITDHWGGGKVYHWSRRWSAIMSAPSELGLRSEVSPRTA